MPMPPKIRTKTRQTGPPPVAEREVVKECLAYLRLRNILAWRNNTGGARLPGRNGKTQLVRFGEPGVSDIIAVLPGGRACFIEAKRPVGGRLSPAQIAFLDNARAAGAVAVVVTSVNELAGMLAALEGE